MDYLCAVMDNFNFLFVCMKKAFFVIFATFCLAACSEGGFSRAESELIGTSDEGAMRLVTTDNPADSLFLRRTARPLLDEHISSPAFKVLCDRMLATVTDPLNDGVGIAAPQVGLDYALVAVQRFDKAGEPFEFFVNPSIGWSSESMSLGGEGCLSVPDLYGEVMRHDSVEVIHLDPATLLPVTERVGGFTAVIFQHEIDHLSGRLYIDRAHSVTRE